MSGNSIYGVYILRKCSDIEKFLLMPIPTQKLSRRSCHHALGRRKLLIPPGSILFEKKLFSPTAERGGGNYGLLY